MNFIRQIMYSPITTGILAVANLVFSNGNQWMLITGLVLGIITLMDLFDV